MNGPVALTIFTVLTTALARPWFTQPVSSVVGLGSNTVSGLRQTANTLGAAKSSLVQSGFNTFKTGVNMGAGMLSFLPGMSPFANVGATFLNTNADTMNTQLQGKIKSMLAFENAKLDIVDNGLKMVGNVAQMGSNIASTLRDGTKLFSSLPGFSAVSNIPSFPGMASTMSAAFSGVNSLTSALSGRKDTAPVTSTTPAPTTTTSQPGFFNFFNNFNG